MLGLSGCSFGLMLGLGGTIASPLNLPSADKLEAWWEPNRGIAIASTLRPTGPGSPATVTVTGNLGQAIGLTLICSDVSGGTALGQAKFDAYYDGGITPFATGLTTGASVVLAAIEITAAFTAGVYAVGQRWDGCLDSWTSLVGSAVLQSETLPSQKCDIAWNGHNGLPTIRTPGGTTVLHDSSSGLASTLIGGIDNACSIFFTGKTADAAPSAIRAFWSMCSSTDADPFWDFGIRNGTNTYISNKVGDAGGVASVANAVGGALDTNFHRYRVIKTTTQIKYYEDGALIRALQNQTLPAEALTVDTFAVFCRRLAGLQSNVISGDIGSILCYRTAIPDADADVIDNTYLAGRWAL